MVGVVWWAQFRIKMNKCCNGKIKAIIYTLEGLHGLSGTKHTTHTSILLLHYLQINLQGLAYPGTHLLKSKIMQGGYR